ncbi:MAG TPA: Crp/Fnr family transcriptional regulator [Candidatus Cybelea sp.]|nr:Crp/Fnr family transcriptional regulator [Candidatus Cybelea sp.]
MATHCIPIHSEWSSIRPNFVFSKSRFLQGLGRPELTAVLAAGSEHTFLARSVVVHQEDPADQFYLLVEGSARHFYVTEVGHKVLLLWLAPGDVFGARAVLREPSHYLFGTETVIKSRVLRWSRHTVRELVMRYPRLSDNVLSIASDYFTWFLSAHLALISHDARERVAQVLLSLAEGIGRERQGGVELRLTNEELANAANVSYFTASRLLGEWRRKGALSKSRGKVVLRSPRGLLPRGGEVMNVHHTSQLG